MCRRWRSGGSITDISNSLTLHSSLHQQLVNINTRLNEVDQCCFWQVDEYNLMTRTSWRRCEKVSEKIFVNTIWWIESIYYVSWKLPLKAHEENSRRFRFRVSCSWFKAFMKLKGEALYEDNSRKRLPLMQRKLPLMRIQGEDGKNKAKAVYSLWRKFDVNKVKSFKTSKLPLKRI